MLSSRNLLRKKDRFLQGAQFIIHLLQFTLRLTGRYHSRPGLVSQRIILAEQTADHDSLVAATIKSHKPDTTAIVAPRRWLIGIDQFHSLEFRSAAQSTGRKSSGQQLERIISVPQRPPHLAHQVYDMRIILHLAVMLHPDTIAGTAEII